MRWTRESMGAAMLGFGLLAIVPAATVNAEPIVIKYEGPNSQSYKPGRKLLSTAKITLKAGEVLTVLDDRGTRTLRGPGTFGASSSATAGRVSNTSLAALVTASSVRRARTGAVRGESPGQPAEANPNLWFIDIDRSGKFCVADFESLQLWRTNAAETQQMTANDSSGVKSTIKFNKGRTTARWPSAMAAKDGGRYNITVPGNAETTSLELVQIDVTGDEGLEAIASKLLDRGCQAQGERLAAAFTQAEPKPAGGS